MSATRAQRIGIWIIAVFMAVGTIGSFVIIVLANQNQQTDQARANELMAAYQKENEAHQAELEARNAELVAQTDELSAKWFSTFNSAASPRVGAFDAASVTELKKEDITVGDGETIDQDSAFVAYYLGWNPSGKIFDGSIDGDKLKTPLAVSPGSVIQGWTQGVEGMKVNGIREISIPSQLAYGETGSGEDIPANTPIKFVVLIIRKDSVIEAPEPSAELIRLYEQGLVQ